MTGKFHLGGRARSPDLAGALAKASGRRKGGSPLRWGIGHRAWLRRWGIGHRASLRRWGRLSPDYPGDEYVLIHSLAHALMAEIALSDTQERLRALADPNAAPLRSAPKEVEAIFVAAGANWLVSFNNLSRVSGPMQDAYCSLSTGGGYAGRALYTNRDESLIECQRPVIINGINPIAPQHAVGCD